MSSNQAHVLKAKNLSKKYQDISAIKNLDLTLYKGECLSVLGANGAGKTTLVEMLEGLIEPSSGEIEIFGLNWQKNRDEIAQKTGVILQHTYLYKRYTVRETLELFESFYTNSLSPDDIIKRLGLEDKAETRLMNLSGGQKQRVYIGCAIINQPGVLFLDEPTTGLDPKARRDIWNLLVEIKQAGTTLVLTTHYMEEAEFLADRIAVLEKGEVIELNSPNNLIKKFCDYNILSFSFKDIEAFLKHKTALSWFDKLKQVGEVYSIFDSGKLTYITELLSFVEKNDLKLDSLQLRQASLEDVFLTLTGRKIND